MKKMISTSLAIACASTMFFTATTTTEAAVKVAAPKTIVKSTASNALTVSYGKVKNAHRYDIYRATSLKGKYTKLVSTKKLAYKNTKLKASTNYYYKVRAANVVKGKTTYSPFSKVATAKTKAATPNYKHAVGSYLVGKDIPAGEYVIIAPKGSFEKATNPSDDTTIFHSDYFENKYYVKLTKNTFFRMRSTSGYFIAVNKMKHVLASAPTKVGMYKVGVDLKAGLHKLDSSKFGYYRILDGRKLGERDSTIKSGSVIGTQYVDVQAGQYLLLSKY